MDAASIAVAMQLSTHMSLIGTLSPTILRERMFVAVGFKPGIIGPRLPLVRPNREGTSDEIAAQENDERGNRTTFQGGTRAAAGVRLTDAGRERFTASDGIRPLHTRISSGAVALEAVHGQVA